MSTPVIVTAIFEPAPGQYDAVVEALKPTIAAVHEEPGCELYAIHNDMHGVIVMIEKWETEELLDKHAAGAAVAAQNAALEGLLARPVEVTRMAPIPAGTEAQGLL
ncbi:MULTISPECIES: antibiotic biosynthesis monooxygenase [unclassified Diaminobutyricimonas]|uniref:putative quinol monooxygenase n=1 Tax=unclassified Diaminobutyricimonas TaxID=2643261 RepID=UPI0012F51170|nr:MULTISPECIES: antibiotic biosynthesis monooxygenase [unclassified Diaminobutyricimonas]